MRLIHFLGVRTYSVELRRDLEELEKNFNDLVRRVAPLFANEPASSFTNTNNNEIVLPAGALEDPSNPVILTTTPGTSRKAMRADGAPKLSQAIAPTWTAQHTWTPSEDVVPVTINAIAAQTENMQTWNPTQGYDSSVDAAGHVAIRDESSTAMLSIRGLASPAPSTFIEFTGANQILNITNGSNDNWLYTSNTSFTVEMLVMFPIGFSTNFIFGGHGATVAGVEQWSWRVGINSSGQIGAGHIDSASSVANYAAFASGAGADIRDGQWHHVGLKIQHSPRTISVYVDGSLTTTAATGVTPLDDLSTSFTGAPSPTNFIRFGELLSPSEFGGDPTGMCLGGLLIRDGTDFVSTPPNFHELIPPDEVATTPDIKHYWPMTEGAGQAFADEGSFVEARNGYFGTDSSNADSADPDWSTAVAGDEDPLPLTHWKSSDGTVDSIVTEDLNWGLGNSSPAVKLHVASSGSQLRLQHTDSITNYTQFKTPSGSAEITYTLPSTNALATVGVLHNSIPSAGASTWSWSLVSLTADVTGTLPVANGGTGAVTLTGLLQGNGTSAVTAITNSTTVGQVLRVTGSNTYAWGALDLADTDAITNDLPYANLTPSGSASKLLGRGSGSAGDWQEITLGTGLTMTSTTLSASGGSGDVATDTIWDAKGDIAVGTGADTAVALSVGTDGQVLVADSGATEGVAWATLTGATPIVVSDSDFMVATVLLDSLLGSSQTSFTVSSVAAGAYDYIEIELHLRGDVAATADQVRLSLNSDTTDANYRLAYNYGGGTTEPGTESFGSADRRNIGNMPGASFSSPNSNSFSAIRVVIPNPGSAKYKAYTSVGNYRATTTEIYSTNIGSEWENTAAIDTLTITPVNSTNFVAGSRCIIKGFKQQTLVTAVTGNTAPHDLLDGSVHQDTVADTVVKGDLIVGNTTPAWERLGVGTDGYVLTADSGEAQGMVWAPAASSGPHDLLSAEHTDTVASAVSRGSLIVGNASPAWEELAIGSSGTLLRSDGTDAAWASLSTAGIQPLDADLTQIAAVSNVRGDLLVTDATPEWVRLPVGSASTLLKSDGTDPSWGTVNLLSAFHGDTLAGTVVRGDLIVGNSTPKWARLALGTGGYLLRSNGTDVEWESAFNMGLVGYFGGGGTPDYLPRWTGLNQLGDSYLSQSGSVTYINSNLYPAVDVSYTLGNQALTFARVFAQAFRASSSSSPLEVDTWNTDTLDYSTRISISSGSGGLASMDILTMSTVGFDSANLINITGVIANTFNDLGISAGAGSVLVVSTGKTFTVNSTLTLAGTDSTTMTFPTTSASIARTDAAQTFTGTQTVRAAATQDSIALAGRAGGTSSFVGTFTPTTLSASRTYTMPDATGTVALTGNKLSVFAATTSAELAGVISDELGFSSGEKLIFAAGTLAITSGKTLTATHSLTLAGTDSTTMTFPTTTATIARTDAAQSFTGAQTFKDGIIIGETADTEGRIDSVVGNAESAVQLLYKPSVALTSGTDRYIHQFQDSAGNVGLTQQADGTWVFNGSNLSGSYITVTGTIPASAHRACFFNVTYGASTGTTIGQVATAVAGAQFSGTDTASTTATGVIAGAFINNTIAARAHTEIVGGLFSPAPTITSGSFAHGTIYGFRVRGVGTAMGSTATAVYGGHIPAMLTGVTPATTDAYGLMIDEQTQATNKYGLWLGSATTGYKSLVLGHVDAYIGGTGGDLTLNATTFNIVFYDNEIVSYDDDMVTY